MKFYTRSVLVVSVFVLFSVHCYRQFMLVKKNSHVASIEYVLQEFVSNQDRQAALLHYFDYFNNQTGADEFVVPNIVHYVRFKKKSWTFVEYICLRSAYVQQKPDYIVIHTDVDASDFRGKYWRWMQEESDLKSRLIILPTEIPTEIFGQRIRDIYRIHHGSDICRIRALIKYGGIYLDNDVYVVNNLDKYRKFEMTVGWINHPNETLGSMVLIANKNARFLSLYYDNYKKYEEDKW